MSEILDEYFSNYKKALEDFLNNSENRLRLDETVELLKNTKNTEAVIYLVGNGGSSAIAEHMAIDLTKNAGLRAMAISGSPMLTTFSNDFGYEKVFQKAIEHFGNSQDILIAISSGGTSRNIINACAAAKDKGMKIITFSGFDRNNPLSKEGDFNFWVNSRAFGYVELIHNLILHYINDAIIGSAEYMIR
ncbi:MAG: SIS domain-containing protein [Candidatus Omnitrophica bacterium]|nr:SIS domain-containing protein [Candidatus Omnitrophota bacterium]MDD5430517.1 SIS domain-containing protein [Candidatus Omnitrophota bacterium]